MTSLRSYVARARQLPPQLVLQRAASLAIRILGGQAQRLRDRVRPSFGAHIPAGPWRWRLSLGRRELPVISSKAQAATALRYVQHCFDILGSGWVEIRHGTACPGFGGQGYPPAQAVDADPDGRWLASRINAANLAESRRIWRMIRFPYVPIDWQLDIKSGYRWSEKQWFRDIGYGNRPGVDVKVPWELARLQHLPQLALAYRAAIAKTAGFITPDRYQDEVQNQILDFVANNPPRFGVNWACPMDVAIRVANMLVAVDLLRDAGADVEPAFLALLARSVRDHAIHILANLEWSPEGRGNHYLADVAGLVFAAAYLPRTPEFDSWLAFAVRELLTETERQFLADGGNFEASTGYHRLSAELVLFAAALVLGLESDEVAALARPPRPVKVRPPQSGTPLEIHVVVGRETLIPPSVMSTLAKAAALTRDATKPDARVVQWGDNDSGRLFKLQPAWSRDPGAPNSAETWVDDPLDHRAFMAGAAALTRDLELAEFAGEWIDADVVTALARNIAAPARPPAPDTIRADDFDLDLFIASIEALPEGSRRRIECPLPRNALRDLQRVVYPGFGHYVFRGSCLFLAVRCPPGFSSVAGHAHDDTLAVELQVDGRAIFEDPGTYVYTPIPQERNEYRIARAHSVPRPAGFPGMDLSRGLFEAGNMLPGRCLYFGPRGFAGEAIGSEWRVARVILLKEDGLTLMDASWNSPLMDFAPLASLPRVCWGYGRKTTRPPRSF